MDDLAFLQREFAAEEGSFLGRLRPDMVWDKVAFTHLEQAMRRICADLEGHDELPSWLVEGFWHCSDGVRDWTSHPNFPRPTPEEYYASAIERLFDLQYWFVMGESPYLPGTPWAEI